MTPPGSIGSDVEACRKLIEGLPSGLASRIRITPSSLDECEVKWLISSTDWFCGTRMHSTIAALSSSVPTAAVAYSDKTRGVFESCGVEDQVVDPRKLDTGAVVERLLESFHNRDKLSQTLSRTIPDVKSRAAAQFEVIAETLKETR
jgi:polysaccharide pyruvyl transferase WcaK-like protein